MPHDVPSTISSWAFVIERTLRQVYTCDPTALFDQVGIDRRRLHDAHYRIPVSQMTRLWRGAVALSGDPCVGLQVARQVSPTTFHALGFAVMASGNMFEAVQRIIQHATAISDIAQPTLSITEGRAWLRFDVSAAAEEVADEAIDAFLAAIIFMGRHYVGIDAPIEAVHLRRPEIAGRHDFEDFFRVPVLFDQPLNAFVANLSVATQAFPSANAALAAANEQALLDYRDRHADLSLREYALRWIAECLPVEPRQAQLAHDLHMSVRTLQRKLDAENSGFQELLDEIRNRRAGEWLASDDMTIQQISDALAFANPSAFTRAFRRWRGESPEQWRRKAQVRR